MKRMFRGSDGGTDSGAVSPGRRSVRHGRSPPGERGGPAGRQLYTGSFLTGTLVGISDHIYRQTDRYAFETQHFPNSPNQPNFPSTELKAGQTQNTTTIFAFAS